MGVIRVHLFGFFLAVFCVFAIGFSEGNRRIVKEDSSQEIDENTAEKVWICCRKELEEITKTIKDFNLYSNYSPKLSRKTLKRSLLLYLKSKRSPSRVTGRDECEKCISKLYNHNIQSKNSQERRHRQRNKRRPHGSLGSVRKAASPARKDSIRLEKTALRSDLKSKKKPPDHVILIGIIVSTAVATLALFVLLLFCCLGGDEQKLGSDFAEKEEKPVVDICPGHILGSSQTSKSFEGNKDLINSSSTNNLSGNATCQTPEVGKLPLPPGRTAPPPPPPAAPPKPPAPKAPPPPPIPSSARPPGPPKPGNMKRPPGPPPRGPASGEENDRSASSNSPKTKLKPLFWDKMNTSPNQSMVWSEVKAGSFQ